MISLLLIDDDPELLEIISLELGYESDFIIQTCDSPSGAIDLALTTGFDSIICDCCMPGMDGCSLLQHLRSRGCSAQFILYSGKEQDDAMTKTLTRYDGFYVQRQGNPEAEFRTLKKLISSGTSARKHPHQ
jgi:CheY-like chemotaxis protein